MLPHVSNGFVIDTSQELTAVYRLNAFSSIDVKKNRSIPCNNSINDYFVNRFGGNKFSYVANGRHGIFIALEAIGLQPEDCVTILTTTSNFYISSCVTKEIEKFCSWSRVIQENTKAIFVNHEFGYPYSDIGSLRNYGVPIIEDCCYAFNSKQAGKHVGVVGDFAIYSFAKFFSIQFGGLIVCNSDYKIQERYLDVDSEVYIKSFLSFHQKNIENISEKRRYNHELISKKLLEIGLKPRFDLHNDVVPGVYMFKSNNGVDLVKLKDFLWLRGIHCSVFYGEESFFIPVHQDLDEDDFDYFRDCINDFLVSNK